MGNNTSTLKVTIQRIVFEKDGFIIAKTVDGDSIQGNVHHQSKELVNTELELTGEWKNSEKYGASFSFSNYNIAGNYNLFFLTRMIKGISQSVAIDILSKAKDLGYIIENEPRALLGISGIGEKKLALIVSTWKENAPFQELASVLLPYGISPSKIRQIFNYYKEKNVSAILEIKKNPYVLTKIDGVGFKRADEIALKLGMEPSNPHRIYSGIEYAIRDYSQQGGHTYCELSDLFSFASNLLNIVDGISVEVDASKVDGIHNTEKKLLTFTLSEETFRVGCEDMFVSGRMVTVGGDNQKVSIPYIERAERNIATILRNYAHVERPSLLQDIDSYIASVEEKNGFRFGAQQKEAIRLSNYDFPITYLYGLAGSGKTTISKTILDIYSFRYGADKIRCCSLSGVASARSQQVTGYQGQTIHSLLKYKGGADGFEFNENNKLPYRVILLDESSMADSYLFASLVLAIDFEYSTLVCVGDHSQLPSIGSGQVFKDIVVNNYCYGTELDEVFRQSGEQVINVFATNYIRKGIVPTEYKNNSFEDFSFIPVEISNQWALKKSCSDAEWKQHRENNNIRIAQTIEDIAKNYAGAMTLYQQKDIKGYISAFQVISPQKHGAVGIHALNKRLQRVLNPYKYESSLLLNTNRLKRGGGNTGLDDDFIEFKPRDKVVHLQNENKKVCSPEFYKANRHSIQQLLQSDQVTERKIFNGQIGVIVDVFCDDDNDVVSVYFPDEDVVVFYTQNDFEVGMLQHSFCLTLHKSQGGEYDAVAVVYSMSHFNMLTNELTYTAVTRAKKMLYVVGESHAFEKGIKQFGNSVRKTILSLGIGENKNPDFM